MEVPIILGLCGYIAYQEWRIGRTIILASSMKDYISALHKKVGLKDIWEDE